MLKKIEKGKSNPCKGLWVLDLEKCVYPVYPHCSPFKRISLHCYSLPLLGGMQICSSRGSAAEGLLFLCFADEKTTCHPLAPLIRLAGQRAGLNWYEVDRSPGASRILSLSELWSEGTGHVVINIELCPCCPDSHVNLLFIRKMWRMIWLLHLLYSRLVILGKSSRS